jgi:L-ascorbate metabolism protein UlaG (beta-lactamase superfamily)
MQNFLTWYGHSTLGLEIGDYKILIDPYFSGNPVSKTDPAGISVDFILITHGHSDHVGDTIAIAKRTNALVISNYEICNWLAQKGLRTHAQHIGGGYQHPFGYLKLTQAMHGSSLPDGSYGGNPAGFLLTTLNDQKYYFAGDTGLFGDMRLIGDEGIHLAVLPIGDNYTMGPADALRAVHFLNPGWVLPIHFSTFKVIQQDAAAWASQVESGTNTKVRLVGPGERIEI